MLRLLAVLGLIGAAVWWWWEPDRDRAARARTSRAEDISEADPGAEEVEPNGDVSGFIDGDGWAPARLSVVEVVDSVGRPVEGALVVVFDFDLETLCDRRIAADVTDARGLAHFDELDASTAKARKPGYAVGSARAGQEEEKVRITLQPSLVTRGRAVVLG